MVYYANIILLTVFLILYQPFLLKEPLTVHMLHKWFFLCIEYRILLELFCYNDKITL